MGIRLQQSGKRGLMDRSKSGTGLRMIHIAVIPSTGKAELCTDGMQEHCCGMHPLWQEVDRSIARAIEEDGRFVYQLAFYQSVSGVMNSKKEFDILILFIEKEGMNEMRPEEMRWMKNTAARIICLADGMAFVKNAFRIGVFRYILKEDIEKDLMEAVQEVLQEMKPVEGLRLTVDGEDKWVLFKDIYYIEAFGDEAIIYKKDTYSTVRKTMDYLSQQLGNAFYRCHKSYIVNFAHVLRIENTNVILKDARSVPVSVRSKNGLEKVYHSYEEGLNGRG